ncbi:hypothetical protein [Nitrosospira sp. Nsp1]|uniref:hypothetical protein n=1 Tax=Nitrosospira sp. Nsp1 TaxID=136547 RepID=UPI0008912DFE|nr:hypothetical protein [Nitrosospira sp. Nsp1]SCX58744.1 hypothetical protein SAMN05720354_1222 [Nitrosospira sp. Nsp1]
MEEPFLYKGDEPILWSPSQVVEFVGLLNKLGYTQRFIEESKGFSISVPKDFINFSKQFLFRNKAYEKSEEARDVIKSAHCPKRPDPPFPE